MCENRRNLEKQNAWADSVAIRDFMENVEIKEIAYGDGPREKMDIIRPKKSLEEKFDVKANMFNCGVVDLKNMIEKGFPDVDLMAEAYTGHPAEEILSGRWDDEMKKINPFIYISESYPPTFLLYGSLDSLRFNTFAMADRLKELKVPYSLYKSTGIFYGQHTTTMILRSRKAFRVFDDISGWLREVLKKEDEIAAVGQDMIV